MITLGLAELASAAVLMFPSLFGGEEGITGDRSDGPALFGLGFGRQWNVYFLIATWAFGCSFLMWRYTATPLGRLANAVRDDDQRVSFIGYDPARVRFLVFLLSGLFAGIAGGLQALNDEIVTSTNVSSEASGAVLLMTFIGGVGTFWGPVLGAMLVTFLQIALSTMTDAWQLYDGLLFLAAVVWAPGGLSGIILAHAPLLRAGRGGALVGPYAAQLPGLALALAGVVWLAELGFRLQAVRNGAPAGLLLGMTARPHEIWQWAIGVALLLAGAVCCCIASGRAPGRPGRRRWRRRPPHERRRHHSRAGGLRRRPVQPDDGAVAALAIRDLRKSFGPTAIIKGVTLEVAVGERHAVIGPNGAGKSTFLPPGQRPAASGCWADPAERRRRDRPGAARDQPARAVAVVPGHRAVRADVGVREPARRRHAGARRRLRLHPSDRQPGEAERQGRGNAGAHRPCPLAAMLPPGRSPMPTSARLRSASRSPATPRSCCSTSRPPG